MGISKTTVNCKLTYSVSPQTHIFLIGLLFANLAVSGVLKHLKTQRPELSFLIQTISLTIISMYFFLPRNNYPQVHTNLIIDDLYTKSVLSESDRIPVFGIKSLNFWEPSLSLSLTCFFIFWIVELNGFCKWLFSRPLFSFLGKISFGLYLLHDGTNIRSFFLK